MLAKNVGLPNQEVIADVEAGHGGEVCFGDAEAEAKGGLGAV